MLWYVSLFASILLVVVSAGIIFEPKFGKLRVGIALICLLLSTYIIYFPVYVAQYDIVAGIFGNFINLLQVISLDADYLANYLLIKDSIPSHLFSRVYFVFLGIIHFSLPAVSAVAAYTLIVKFFTNLQMMALSLRKREVYVFSEINEKAVCLAKDIRANGKCDILFCSGTTDDEAKELQSSLNCVIKDEEIGTLKLPLKRKCTYFCISENDDENLISALRLIERYGKCSAEIQKKVNILIFTEDDEVDTMIDSTEKGVIGLSIIKQSEMLAYKLLYEHPIYKSAENGKIELLICGLGSLGLSILKTAAWCGMLDGYSTRINVIGENIEKAAAELRCTCPGLFGERYDINIYNCKNREEFCKSVEENALGATYVVVCDGGGVEDLERAVMLRRMFYCSSPDYSKKPEIFVYTEDSAMHGMIKDLRTSELRADRRVSYDLIPFGGIETIYNYRELVDSDIEKLAKNVHLVYSDIFCQGELDVAASLAEYNLLEVNKRSNKANALHIRYKLALIGLDYTEGDEGEDAELSEHLDEATLQRLTIAEHDRWMAFLESEGWVASDLQQVEGYKSARLSGGRHNCPLLKMHPYICPFEELKELAEKLSLPDSTVYDRCLITRIPDILGDAWGVSGKKYRIIKMQDK